MDIPIEILDTFNFITDPKVYGSLVALFAVIKIIAYFKGGIKIFLKRRTTEMKQNKLQKLQAKIDKANKGSVDKQMLDMLQLIATKLGIDTKGAK
jgi:hypothetical protein